MCFYKGIRVTREQLLELLAKEKELATIDLKMVAGFDYSDFPIIKPVEIDGCPNWEFENMQWGFAPSFARTSDELKDARFKYATYNARNDKLLSSKIWRDAALNRRCLIPLTHFYEYRHMPLNFWKKGSPSK